MVKEDFLSYLQAAREHHKNLGTVGQREGCVQLVQLAFGEPQEAICPIVKFTETFDGQRIQTSLSTYNNSPIRIGILSGIITASEYTLKMLSGSFSRVNRLERHRHLGLVVSMINQKNNDAHMFGVLQRGLLPTTHQENFVEKNAHVLVDGLSPATYLLGSVREIASMINTKVKEGYIFHYQLVQRKERTIRFFLHK